MYLRLILASHLYLFETDPGCNLPVSNGEEKKKATFFGKLILLVQVST